jgi:hypothetical protein
MGREGHCEVFHRANLLYNSIAASLLDFLGGCGKARAFGKKVYAAVISSIYLSFTNIKYVF